MTGPVKIFVDTNVLIYARDVNAGPKRDAAAAWLSLLGAQSLAHLNLQVLNELTRWLLVRNGPDAIDAVRQDVEALRSWGDRPIDRSEMQLAWAIRGATGYQWFDCLLLAAAEGAGCSHFLSEDMDAGRLIGSVRIVDPFRTAPSDILPAH